MKRLFILGLLTLSISGLQVVKADDCSDIVDGARQVTADVAEETSTTSSPAESE